MRNLLLSTLSVLFCLASFAQDPLANQFQYYQKAKYNSSLFVHFDKNVYANGETVWFTGYVINTQKMSNHHLLSVALINDENNKVVLEDRFLLQDGLSFGNIVMPDSIQPGNYRLQAITDYTVNGKPDAVFVQPITIKSILEPPFKASMKIISADQKGAKVLISATTADNRFLPKPTRISYRYGHVKKVVNTDASGQALIHLDTQEGLTDANLHVKLHYEKDSTSLNMPLPQPKGVPTVKFYPEGGDMVSGLLNNIGWEVRDQQKKPIATKAYLYKNNIAIDTINSNLHGFGTFKLIAEDGAVYRLKVVAPTLKDTLFTLPVTKTQGLTINIATAVVLDTLKISIRSKQEQQIGLRLHNFKTSYLYTTIELKSGLRTIKVPLTEIPKGLATLTITDSEHRPLAERMFFAHYDNKEKLHVSTDKQTYGSREKVSLKVKLADADDQGIVSVAVVQDSRIDPHKMTDIESYALLKKELTSFSMANKGESFKDKSYLEQLLLIKGWRRYNWQELLQGKAADTAHTYSYLQLIGSVNKGKKTLTKPVSVAAMGGDQIRWLNTTDNGTFNFNTPELFAKSGKKLYLFLSKENDPAYHFSTANQLLETSSLLASSPLLEDQIPLLSMPDNADLFVKTSEKSIRLKEVLITDKGAMKRKFGPNPCGDYVCVRGILNCHNHYNDPNSTQPVQGKSYIINGTKSVYQGCNVTEESSYFKTEGIHIHKDFYVDSYADPLEPAYFSTIFWKYAAMLKGNNETNLDFYTSDITGKFRVIIQGVTLKQVVYAEKTFEVKKN